MSSDWNALDRQAPIPYVRDPKKKAYEVPTVKFQFEREQTKTVTKETLDDHGVPTGHTVETSTYLKDCKITLKTYAHSSDEDGEHWLEALRMVQKELAVEWKKAETAKTNDATVLFQAIDRVCQHSANAEWMDCISRWDKKYPNKTAETWEKFKLCVVDFTTRVVFKPDAYDRQKSYLQERIKPFDLSAKEWSLRLETVSGEMPWLMTSVAKLQKETVPTANWTDLWVLGYLTEAEKRRIMFTKMPPSWNRTIQLTDTSRELQDRADIATVTSHLATLESLEKADRLRNTRITGRSSRAGRISASTRPPNRPQTYRRYLSRPNYSGQQYNSSTYPRYQPQQQLQSGGRPGYPTRPAYGSGQGFDRSRQGRPQQGQGYPNRGGRPGQRSFGGQRSGFARPNGPPAPAARSNDQFYWQEEAGQYDGGYYPEEYEQVAEEVHMTEEERTLIDQWNDNMFVSSDSTNEGWYAAEEQYAVEEDVEQEAYYGEDEPGSTSEVYEDAYEEDPQWLQPGW